MDIEKLKAEIKAEVIKDLTKQDYHTAGKKESLFNQVREKYMERLHKAFGNVWYWQVWEKIRSLSCYMVGVRYVRDLTPSKEKEAAEIAEKLLIMAIEAMESEGDK